MVETQQQESISDRPEEEQYGEDDSVDEDDSDEYLSDEYSSDRADLSEDARRLAHEYNIDSPCSNFQNVAFIAQSYFDVMFRDFSCNCQFCGPVLPKVLDIVERERHGEEIQSIYGLLQRFRPISINILFTNGPWLRISLYSPTENGETPTCIRSLSVRHFSTLRHVEQHSSSSKCFDLARHWFHDCVEHHETCKASSKPRLPKRYLAISNQQAHPTVQLVVDSGLEGPYAALSHCWGTDKFLCLTTTNVGKLEQDVPWGSLPRSFQDAIKVCLELELSNLWIDSLCILQDSKDDWEMQSVCMAKIYQDATVVIAASSAHGAHEGFLGLRKEYFDDCLISPDSNSRGLYAMPEIHSDESDSGQTLSKRAWAFQERLLARRYLSFDQKELHWECESSWYCECGVSDWNGNEAYTYSLRRLCGTATNQDQAHYVWRHTIVPCYSERALSVTSDRLPALSAIARVFQAKLQDTYLAGLWKRDLLKGLCWSRGFMFGDHPDSPRGNIAPTWTWCAVEAPGYNRVSSTKFMPYCQCLAAECMPSGMNDLGKVRDGFITLRGPLVRAFVGLSANGINLGDDIQIWASRKQDGDPNGLRQICDFRPDGVVVKKPEENQDVPSETTVVLTTWQVVKSSLEATQLDGFGSWDTNNASHTFAPVWCLRIGEQEDFYAATELRSFALVLSTSPKRPERFIRIGLSWVKKGEHNDLFSNPRTTVVTIE